MMPRIANKGLVVPFDLSFDLDQAINTGYKPKLGKASERKHIQELAKLLTDF